MTGPVDRLSGHFHSLNRRHFLEPELGPCLTGVGADVLGGRASSPSLLAAAFLHSRSTNLC